MPETAKVTRRLSILGDVFDFSADVDANVATDIPKTLAAAKTGQLTTRTSNTVGTLTMTAGHGITTAALLDIYWTNTDGTYGRRYNATVGTVATNSVPFTAGQGDNLPVNLTNVTAMVPTVQAYVAVAANIVFAAARCVGSQATLVFTQSDGTFVVVLKPNKTPPAAVWHTGLGTTPFGADVGKVYFSHGDANAARDVLVTVGYN